MKNIKVFLFAALAGAFLLFRCTSGSTDAPTDAAAADTTAAATPAPAPDLNPPIPDSMDVGKVGANVYRLLADSLGLRVYEIQFKPGDEVAMHSHPDNAIYVLEGGTLETSEPDGKKAVYDLKPGMGLVFGPGTHSGKNIGKTTVKAVIVELRRPR
jgi:quercetin dioxygenase-like cupin family protein